MQLLLFHLLYSSSSSSDDSTSSSRRSNILFTFLYSRIRNCLTSIPNSFWNLKMWVDWVLVLESLVDGVPDLGQDCGTLAFQLCILFLDQLVPLLQSLQEDVGVFGRCCLIVPFHILEKMLHGPPDPMSTQQSCAKKSWMGACVAPITI